MTAETTSRTRTTCGGSSVARAGKKNTCPKSKSCGWNGRNHMERILKWLVRRLPMAVIERDNKPYLFRYYLWKSKKPNGPAAFIHHIVDSDPDVELHDHPWDVSRAVILSGGYREQRYTTTYPWSEGMLGITERLFTPGMVNTIRSNDFHRILLSPGTSAWTLFIHGRRTKGWGFKTRYGEYRPHTERVRKEVEA